MWFGNPLFDGIRIWKFRKIPQKIPSNLSAEVVCRWTTPNDKNRKTRHISGFPMSLQTLLNCYLVPKAGLEPARPEGIGF